MRIAIIFFICICCFSSVIYAQHYTPVDKGSKIEFRVNNHKDGNEVVKGTFSNLKGDIVFDPAHPEKSSFDVAVNAGTINTGLAERDKELKHESWFSQSLYPTIRVKSTSVTADGKSGIIFILHGNLTMKGITKPVNIQFTATPVGTGYLFRGSFHLKRLDYNVGQKGEVNNDVSLFMEIKANRK